MISENQSVFRLGRLIINNALVAYEMIHFLRQKRRGKGPFVDKIRHEQGLQWSGMQFFGSNNEENGVCSLVGRFDMFSVRSVTSEF